MPEMDERQKRVLERMEELGITPLQASMVYFPLQYVFTFFQCLQEKAPDGKRCSPVCHQLRTASDRTPDGQIHHVLGRSNKIWCPYADDKAILEALEKEQKERMQVAW